MASTQVETLVRELLDEETGELREVPIEVRTRSIRYEEEPEYVKLYIKTVGVFTDLKGTSSRLFYELAKRMEYANKEQIVFLNPQLRKFIQDDMGVKKSAFDKALRELREKGLIRRVANNTFAVNPMYVGKGGWRDIKRLRATFDFITGNVDTDFGYADES